MRLFVFEVEVGVRKGFLEKRYLRGINNSHFDVMEEGHSRRK